MTRAAFMVEMAPLIAAARRRLGWLEIRSAVGGQLPLVCAAAFACAAARPIVWPLHAGSPWWALPRAGLLACAGAAVVTAVLAVRAWRARPSLLASARRLDQALGLEEVVASGYALDAAEGAPSELVRKRAGDALEGVVIERVLAPKPLVRTPLDRRWLYGGVAIAALGLAIGGVDPVLVDRAVHPLTASELAAASELARAAEEAKKEAKANPKVAALADAAQRAAEAAKRGDRKGAREAIEEARAVARALDAEERDQASALRAVQGEIEGGTAGKSSRDAAEALSKMMKELDAKDREELRKMADRLERASSAAAKASGSSGKKESWSRLAEALAEARAAAARGDSEAAKRAMERAASALSDMDKPGSKSSSRIADGASALDRSMHAARSGSPSAGEGKDGTSGKAASNEGKDGKAGGKPSGEPSGAPGTGPGQGDRAAGPEQRRVKVNGELKARTDVREGERAVSAIEGLGRGDDPRAYREIFPSYDTVVEDGLREDAVPAARRPVVRRYFSSIRPGQSDEAITKGSDR